MVIDLIQFTSIELLVLYGRIAAELRRRGIGSTNYLTGNLAEYLFCQAFGWKAAPNSEAHIDATAADGTRYQIKARQIMPHNKSRQLGALRDLDGGHFDYLAGVLFNDDFSILRAALVPHAVVKARAKFVKRTNSYKFNLRDDVWDVPDVKDATSHLTKVTMDSSW